MSTKFRLASSRIVEQAGGKKYVTYEIQIRSQTDVVPVAIERRYTDFLQLYSNLCRNNPKLAFPFPKKVVIGNFGVKLIATRQDSFQAFLALISNNEKMKESTEMKQFLIGAEEREALNLLRLECFSLAKPLLVKMFSVLNKVYTERHPLVLITLCRLAACCSAAADPSSLADAQNYSEIALRRFETVSDVDLLRLYVPLIRMCVSLWWSLGRDSSHLEERLELMRRQGHRVDNCPHLLDATLAC